MPDSFDWVAPWLRSAVERTEDRREELGSDIPRLLSESMASGEVFHPDLLLHYLLRSICATGSAERDLCAPLGAQVALAEADIDPTRHSAYIDCLEHLGAANLLQIMGVDVDAASVDRAADWLVGLDTAHVEPPSYDWSKGAAALALDRPLVYRAVAALPEEGAPPYDAKAKPGLNSQAWLAQFAGAVEHGVAGEEAVVLWRRFLGIYGMLVDVDAIMDYDIAWIARIVRHRIGGQPLDSVADWLCAEIHAATGLDAPEFRA